MKSYLPIETLVKKNEVLINYWDFSSKTETSIGICGFSLKMKPQLSIKIFIKILKKKYIFMTRLLRDIKYVTLKISLIKWINLFFFFNPSVILTQNLKKRLGNLFVRDESNALDFE